MQILISLSSAVEYKGKALFKELNEGRFFPEGIEGYWRPTPKSKEKLPFPVALKVSGYDKEAFIDALSKRQKKARLLNYKGYSKHRWTKERNGAGEYSVGKWKWPEGYITYIRDGVLPSRAFYNFVMKTDLPNLPELHEV